MKPRHYCAVTLLSRPPAPTVLVGPAHCTYLCKSSRGEVDNCCCGGPNDCSDNFERCGKDSKVVDMTGWDAEILCGEWEAGDSPPASSGEEYNIILKINEIIRHPEYAVNIENSAHLQNDIAVFKVDDSQLSMVKYTFLAFLFQELRKCKYTWSIRDYSKLTCALHFALQ